MKKLYEVTGSLLGRVKDNPLLPHTDEVTLANDFLRYFSDKISKLRNELDNIEPESVINTGIESRSRIPCMTEFRPLSESEVCKLITESKSTTCELDILPTPKLKENLHCLAPVVTEIVKRSLLSSVFPSEWKNAVIRPLLKKKELPLELQNYRPVSNLSFLSKVLE